MLATIDTSVLVLTKRLRIGIAARLSILEKRTVDRAAADGSRMRAAIGKGLADAEEVVFVDERSKGGREVAEDGGEAAKQRETESVCYVDESTHVNSAESGQSLSRKHSLATRHCPN